MPADEIACKLLDIPRKCVVCGKVIEEDDLW
jgi:predicted nucleic acid-binding Zn ribbon protein